MTPERERLEMMANPNDPTWDLSPNDRISIQWSLDRIDKLERIAKVIVESSIASGRAFDETRLYDAYREARDMLAKPDGPAVDPDAPVGNFANGGETPTIVESFAELRKAGGDAWDKIADPAEYLGRKDPEPLEEKVEPPKPTAIILYHDRDNQACDVHAYEDRKEAQQVFWAACEAGSDRSVHVQLNGVDMWTWHPASKPTEKGATT